MRSPARSPRSASDVKGWEVGQRVGVGWFGGNCGYCEQCRRGLADRLREHGRSRESRWTAATPTTWSCAPSALASMPDDSRREEAGPLLCAGITTFNALRDSGAVARRPGRGARRRRARPSRRPVRRPARLRDDRHRPRRRQGASSPASSAPTTTSTRPPAIPAEALQALGGADLILATVDRAPTRWRAVFGGLRPKRQAAGRRRLDGPVQVPAAALIGGDKSIDGHASGTSHRLRGHAALQRAHRRAPDDRDDAARAGRRTPTRR